MSKTSFPAQLTAPSKTNSKSKNPLRGSYGKLTLDLNKFDLKSIVPHTTTAQGTQPFTPTSVPLEKVSLISNSRKSPRTNYNHQSPGFPLEGLELRETYTIDNKIQPQTTKSMRSSYLSLNIDKAKKISNQNERVVSSKEKEIQGKGGLQQYDPTKSRKTSQKESLKADLTLQLKDNKHKIGEEGQKKSSIPNNLTINTIYTTTGSNSHRAVLNSPTSEQNNPNRSYSYVYVPLNRRSSQKSEIETEQQPSTYPQSTKHAKSHYPLNNFMNDLIITPHESSKNVSKITMNNSNHMIRGDNNTNTPTEKMLPLSKETRGQLSQYNDLIRQVSDKSKTGQTQEKVKLKSTLSMLTDEINNFKKMKNLLQEKEKTIEKLQSYLYEVVKDSDSLKKELQKNNLMPQDLTPSTTESPTEYKRGKKISSMGDMETVKVLIDQLKALTECTEETQKGEKEYKENLLDIDMTKNFATKTKRSETSYGVYGSEMKTEGTPLSVNHSGINFNIYQRNFSGTFEDPFGNKSIDSPYYEVLRNMTKKEEKNFLGNKKNSTYKKTSPDARKIGMSGMLISTKEKDSLLGTPRKIQIEINKSNKQQLRYENINSADMDILKRKFSHDPRMNLEGTYDLFGKKRLAAEAGSTLAYTTEKEASGEALDIGKALGVLKERISNLLNKHKHDQKKLKETYNTYVQKLDFFE